MYNADYHQKIELEETPQADRLCDYLNKLFSPSRVIDFGCSSGLYLRPWHLLGVETQGLENSLEAIDLRVVPSVGYADLTKPIRIAKYFPDKPELGLCIEVLEHIDPIFEDAVLDNLCSNTHGPLVFSAAKPGQGGENHVNCQHKEHWICAFHERGWHYSMKTAGMIEYMKSGYHMGWFINNAMILEKK